MMQMFHDDEQLYFLIWFTNHSMNKKISTHQEKPVDSVGFGSNIEKWLKT